MGNLHKEKTQLRFCLYISLFLFCVGDGTHVPVQRSEVSLQEPVFSTMSISGIKLRQVPLPTEPSQEPLSCLVLFLHLFSLEFTL